jgi:phosphatidyl-myo-inositol dimannoside synthase
MVPPPSLGREPRAGSAAVTRRAGTPLPPMRTPRLWSRPAGRYSSGRSTPARRAPAAWLPNPAGPNVRLLFVSHSFPPPGRPLANVGGMQRVATELHTALLTLPHVRLSSLLLRSSWRWTHLRIVPFGAGLLRRIPRIVDEERIEAVLFSSMVTAALALPVAGALARRGVVRGAIPVGRDVTLPFTPYQRLVPRIFRSLDAVFPISRATADECLARGASASQVEIVPCGVDFGRFAAPVDRAAARAEMAAGAGGELPGDALLLFAVGRHVERKGFAWFVERVMPVLPPGVHFWLAGEGPATPAVRAAVARNGLEDRVRLLGRVTDVELARLYSGADLFVMPNVPVAGDIEGFGVVMLEAGANGLPVVGAGIEGIRDVVRDGENGHLVPSGDVDAFAGVIRRYAEDRPALHALSRRAARFTRETFGWSSIAERLVRSLGAKSAARAGA